MIRVSIAALLALLALRSLPQSLPNYAWRQVAPTGRGEFEDGWRAGRWPMALRPLVTGTGNDQALFMVGSRGVYRSTDGISWTRTTDAPGWRETHGARSALFRDKLVALGGQTGERYSADVWTSMDGMQWRLTAAPWPGRRNAGVAIFRNRLWLIGGQGDTQFADVWSSADGAHWEQAVSSAPWGSRTPHGGVVLRDSLWVIGGGPWDQATADVWVSGDGREWQLALRSAPWGKRMFPGVAVFDGRLWVLGGVEPNGPRLQDVWSSTDGRTWTRSTAPWTPRAAEHVVVFRSALWLYGGKGKEEDMSSGYAGDIWRMERAGTR
ncbi:MAG: hypothetical protein ACREOG_19665 [Gemmatimonadaceae bacterium]